jgi:hypothetical protein
MSEHKVLTPAEQAEYVKSGYSECPYCGTFDISGRSIDIEANVAWQKVDCSICERDWTDVYFLGSIDQRDGNDEHVPGIEQVCQLPPIKMGDWVMYNGKPREVYKFYPYGGPNCATPNIERDPRYDMVEVLGIKALIPIRNIKRMKVEVGV